MLKRLAIVVFVASVLPINGQEKSPQSTGNQASGDQDKKQSLPPSRTVTCEIKEEGAAIECNWPEAQPEGYFSVLRRPENLPNEGLFVVGVFGVLVGFGTLYLIYLQIIEMRRQVTASHDGLRGWVGVTVKEFEDPTEPFHTLLQRKAFYKIKNYGQTPAFIKSVRASGFSHPNNGKGGLRDFPNPVTPNRFLGAGICEKHMFTLKGADLGQCESGQMVWRFVIQIEYEDVFGKPHETMASFHYYIPRNTSDPLKRRFYQDTDSGTNYNT
jgi:hypothetical protein